MGKTASKIYEFLGKTASKLMGKMGKTASGVPSKKTPQDTLPGRLVRLSSYIRLGAIFEVVLVEHGEVLLIEFVD